MLRKIPFKPNFISENEFVKRLKAPAFDQEKPFLREIRFLPTYVDLKSALYVYGNTVALISTKKEQTAAIIHSTDLAYSLNQLFTFLWSISR